MRKRIQGKRTALCAHEGCTKTIREGSWNFPSGFCTAHQPVAQVDARPERKGVRKITVRLTPGCSTLPASHQVTLPAFPWEAA